ncbi:MAG TPA: DUF4276 family protein [Urbifossiella sp.]|nr:DUF4276 family protein [Urbifossiella sp.]
MARLYLFAERQTEQTFADTVLKPYLANMGVYLQRPVLIAHARRKGKVHRGGGRRYQPMKDDIQRFMKQEKNSGDVFFTTMIDLYAIHDEFPRLVEAESLRKQPFQRVAFLEEAFADDISDRRFVPYIQLHEFEAYLFSDLVWLEFYYDGRDQQIAELKAIANGYTSPELINDGPHTAPSKRIAAHFPDYEDQKVIVGSGVGELIGLPAIRAKCPHFDAWITKLEQLRGVP